MTANGRVFCSGSSVGPGLGNSLLFQAYANRVLERCQVPPGQTRLGLRLLEAYGLTSAMVPA